MYIDNVSVRAINQLSDGVQICTYWCEETYCGSCGGNRWEQVSCGNLLR